ncbi:MAG: [FeFe] hydrogenase H-cluster radical SAM maturase HydE [Candidatus Omnitrophica bacterium]|nr:[FeFe] hydrogenase H-cluster radical SAM maturase HydE [Candidatus Omnitrophota bacterium]
MCYAIPGKVKRFQDKFVIVDYFGEERRAYNELDDLSIGDYIYAQGGYAIQKIASDEAESILMTWKETFFELQEVDLQLSRMDLESKDLSLRVVGLLDKVNHGFSLKTDELEYILGLEDEKEKEFICKNANFLRQKYHKNACCVHGIIEISNRCARDCHYCGISTFNNNLIRYHMDADEIFAVAQKAVKEYSFKALVLQSGEECGYNTRELAGVISKIRRELGALVFISFGEISLEALDQYYQAGARGILLRFETSNEGLYNRLHPGGALARRIDLIRAADKRGYLVATGGLIGLPGATAHDIVNDALLAKELNAEMYSFGPFIPSHDTPLSQSFSVSPDYMRMVIALIRLVDPAKGKILVTTAFETLDPLARRQGLLCGANSVMLNVTPRRYRQLYSIYPGRAHQSQSIPEQIEETIVLLKSLGRAPTDLGI